MKRAGGFTLIELVIVIVILGIIAVSASSRFSNQGTFSVRVEQENLISSLNQAQQLAMAGQVVQFRIISGNSYTIEVGSPATNYNLAGISYPYTLRAGVSLVPNPLTLSYNGLGELSTASTITVNEAGGGSASVVVESSGYARAN